MLVKLLASTDISPDNTCQVLSVLPAIFMPWTSS
jgi:hypothetical protein